MPTGALRSVTLSIIIPSYNAAATIVETVASALAQEDMAAEVIVIDDGSTDDTRDTLESAGLLGAVRYAQQQNQGVSAARNHGLDFACGEFVCFLDSDDLLHPRFGTEMVTLLRNRQFRVGYCNYRYFENVPGHPDVSIRYPTYDA